VDKGRRCPRRVRNPVDGSGTTTGALEDADQAYAF
jgi:hypothetical protein